MTTFDNFYKTLGIKDFFEFISAPGIQDQIFLVKIVFIFFTVLFFGAVIYFYANSSYFSYKFLRDTVEFLSWQPYDLRAINRRWKKIIKKIDSGKESDYNLAIIEADDFLYDLLKGREFAGNTFEDLVESVNRKILPNFADILLAHKARNSIVYDLDYKLDLEQAKKILSDYEKAIKNISTS